MIYLLSCKPNREVYNKIISTLEENGKEYKVYIRKEIPPELLMTAIKYGHEGIFTIVSTIRGGNAKSNYIDSRVKNYNMLMEMPLSRAVDFLLKDSDTRLLLRDNIIIDTDKRCVINNFNDGWDAPYKNKTLSEQRRRRYLAKALEVSPLYSDDYENNTAGNGRKGTNLKKFDEKASRKYREYQKAYREKNKERLKEYQKIYRNRKKESKEFK